MRTMKPSRIYFTQDTIKSEFSSCGTFRGRNVNSVICEIRTSGDTSRLAVQIVKRGGRYYSKNNRTLYVARVLEYYGDLEYIPVELIPYENLGHGFSTFEDGERLRSIRDGGELLPHSISEIEERSNLERRRSMHEQIEEQQDTIRRQRFAHAHNSPEIKMRHNDGPGWGTALAVGAGVLGAVTVAAMAIEHTTNRSGEGATGENDRERARQRQPGNHEDNECVIQ